MSTYGYALDFETFCPEGSSAHVWAWGGMGISDHSDYRTGSDIRSFMKWVITIRRGYFHNLKYDGSYIVDELFRMGYSHSRSKKLDVGQFQCTISSGGKWYKIRIKSWTKYETVLLDSHKKLPFKLERVAKAFKLDQQKGELDYDTPRYPGHIMTELEADYLYRDCYILAEALKIQLDQGLKGMTIGADALASYKAIIGKSKFDYMFPNLSDDVDGYLRESYRGGLTICYKPGEYHKTTCYDNNSLYPYAMTYPIPVGLPIKYEGEYQDNEAYPLFICRIAADFKVKSGKLPTIQIKKGSPWHVSTDYVEDSHGIQELYLTSVDLEVFLDHYEVFDIDYIDGYMFAAHQGTFATYIAYWMNIKETSDGAIRELAKLMLNNLYGKFGKNRDITQKDPQFDDDKNLVKYRTGEKTYGSTVYVAVASFVTAYARRVTLAAAQINFDRFFYCDTDSIHLTEWDEASGIEIHPTKLGAWKHEYLSARSRYIRPKTYCYLEVINKGERVRYKLVVKCAGMPDNVKDSVTWSNFKDGSHFEGKLMPVIVPGGTYLKSTSFTIH